MGLLSTLASTGRFGATRKLPLLSPQARSIPLLAALSLLGGASEATAGIAVSGTVSPAYPAGVDPWDAGFQLNVGDAAAEGSLIIDSGSVVQASYATVGGASPAPGTLVIDGLGSQLTLDGALSVGSAFYEAAGSVQLTGAGSRLYAGADAPDAASMAAPSQTALFVAGSGLEIQVNVEAGSSLVVDGNSYLAPLAGQSATAVVTGTGSTWHSSGDAHVGSGGTATLNLDDGGTLSALGTIHVGPLGVVAGAGTLQGVVSNGGRFEPGGLAIGDLSVVGDWTQGTTGWLNIAAVGFAQGDYDTLQIDGTATLDGTLGVSLFASEGAQLGDSLTVLQSTGSVTGTFAVLNLPDAPAGGIWRVLYRTSEVIVGAARRGDFNLDGQVDGGDLAQWSSNFGTGPNADGNLDGVSNGRDFLLWQRDLGVGPAGIQAAAVPEPSAAAILATLTTVVLSWGVLSWGGRRRRPSPTDLRMRTSSTRRAG